MDASIVSYEEGVSVIADCFASGGLNAALLEGMPGTGKTAMRFSLQKRLSLANCFMIKPGHHDKLDFNGLPVADMPAKRADFLPFGSLLPPSDLKGGTLMVWDEIGDAEVDIQNLIGQAVNEGRFHNYVFPENTYHFLTTNAVAHRSGAKRIITKLGNRVGWWQLVPLLDEVFNHGMKEGWNPMVLAFLKARGNEPINPNDTGKSGFRPTYLNTFDPTDPAQLARPVYASSRSIDYASRMMNYLEAKHPRMDRGAIATRLAGIVGTPWAMAFLGFREDAKHMPDVDDILAGRKVPFPKAEQQSVLWSLALRLVMKADKVTWGHADAYLKQGPAEFRILAVRQAFDNRLAHLIGPAFQATLAEPDVKQAIGSVQ